MQAALRDWFCFLMTTLALRRGQVFSGRVNRYLRFKFVSPQGKEILVLIVVAMEKTNGLKTVYGMAIPVFRYSCLPVYY